MEGRVYLYDAQAGDLREREVQLSRQLRNGGREDDWEIVGTPSRNSLLTQVDADARARPPRESVALIDLKAADSDIDQAGFRVCETIARNGRLSDVTRPLLWADQHTNANLSCAPSVGAIAMIDDAWVDREEGAPLAEVLAWAADQPASPPRAIGMATKVFPPDATSAQEQRNERRVVFESRFGLKMQEAHYSILWGLADCVEIQQLDKFVSEHHDLTRRQAQRLREDLQKQMRSEVDVYDRPEPARAEIAREFLATVAPPEPNPLEVLSWPSLQRLNELICDEEVVSLSYVEDPLLERLRDLVARWQGEYRERLKVEDPAATSLSSSRSKLSQSRHLTLQREELDRAVLWLSEQREENPRRLESGLRFAARALDDAKLDLTQHPKPAA